MRHAPLPHGSQRRCEAGPDQLHPRNPACNPGQLVVSL